MSSKIRYVININNGVVCFRTSATDENPIIFRKIDDETANAVIGKKVSVSAVLEALMKVEANKEGFNWRDYDKRRQAAEKLLNVSQRDMIPIDDDPNKKEEEVDDGDVVTLKDLGVLGEQKESKRSTKKVVQAEEKSASESTSSETVKF